MRKFALTAAALLFVDNLALLSCKSASGGMTLKDDQTPTQAESPPTGSNGTDGPSSDDVPNCTVDLPEGAVCRIKVEALRPTQLAVGMCEVRRKAALYRGKSEKKRIKFISDNPAPAVVGLNGFYLTDHHHLASALLEDGVEFMQIEILKNWSGMDAAAFWANMAGNTPPFVYLVDNKGEAHSASDLAATVAGLKDDPYRSLAGAVRAAGGFEKSSEPFAEFHWAEFLRSRIELAEGECGEAFQQAVEKATQLAHSKEAEDQSPTLPGFMPADSSL